MRLAPCGRFDELRMFRFRVVLGRGTPFLPPAEEIPLDLIETRIFGSRVVLRATVETYRLHRGDRI
jgi:hypothetical protein